MATIANQGNGRLTKGANARLANKKAVATYAENYTRAKQIRNQRITMTDSVTGASIEITRTQFADFTQSVASEFTRERFEKVQRDLFAGREIQIGANYFQIQQTEAAA